MRRLLLGDESRFIESALGRLTLCVLFTTLVGLSLSLLFVLPTGFSPFLLKFVVIIGIGLAASFITRRMLAHRTAALRFAAAAFACVIALAVLSPLTLGFVGLNLLRHYAIATPLDAAIQLLVVGLSAWAGQVAWVAQRRRVLVEPRQGPELTLSARSSRAGGRVRTNTRRAAAGAHSEHAAGPAASRLGAWWAGLFPPPPQAKRKRRTAQPGRKPAESGSGITLSAQERHVCPYCLEPVTKNDPRGVKVCKVCNTWHHGDCWEITGVCQVPHAYEN